MPTVRSIAAAVALAALLPACNTTPFGVVSSVEAERQLAKETIPVFLELNGGEYRDARLKAYVNGIVDRLSRTAVIPEGYAPLELVVLDTATPTAYALPGGAIFVTRGLVAMAQDEAQLAGVIAHEIGHVIARHVAEGIAANERIIKDIVAQERLRLQSTGSRSRRIAIVEEALQERSGEITTFSRAQELEADRIALQLLAEAGYDTGGFDDFLERLEAWQVARARRIGVDPDDLQRVRETSKYPRLPERIAALGLLTQANPDPVGRDRLMSHIDGIVYDDRFYEGTVRDGTYRNRRLRLEFDVPETMLVDHRGGMMLLSKKGAILVRLDDADGRSLEDLSKRIATSSGPISDGRIGRVAGREAIQARLKRGPSGDGQGDVTIFQIEDSFLSFIVFSPGQHRAEFSETYDSVLRSLRHPVNTGAEIRRFRTARASPTDTVSTLASRSAFDGADREREFRLFNGLGAADALSPGDWVKTVE